MKVTVNEGRRVQYAAKPGEEPVVYTEGETFDCTAKQAARLEAGGHVSVEAAKKADDKKPA